METESGCAALEGISQMPKENHCACEVQKAGEISGTPLISGDEAARVLQPREEAFDFPATFVAAQGASILREVDAAGVRPESDEDDLALQVRRCRWR